MIIGCARDKFDPTRYNSFQLGNEYAYSGMMMKTKIDSVNTGSSEIEYFLTDRDSLGQVASREVYVKKDGRIGWKAFDGSIQGMLKHTFDPPLLASPFSDQVGQTFTQEGVEIRSDAQRTTLRYRFTAEIEALEDVAVPAGQFPRCIKMKGVYTYLDPTTSPFINGEARWWFAREVGVVKYEIPGVNGKLLHAIIGQRTLP